MKFNLNLPKFMYSFIKKTSQLIFFLIIFSCLLPAQTRIMTYNIENYGASINDDNTTQYKNEEKRNDDLRMVINSVAPDILAVEEMFGAHSAGERLLNKVVNKNSDSYKMAFIDQKQDNNPEGDVWQDIAIYYKKDKFRLLREQEIDITPGESYVRNALKVKLEKITHKDTLVIFAVHFKAGSGPYDKRKREKEATKLRQYCNQLKEDLPFLICGDFNMYSSNEEAWKILTGQDSNNNGKVYDPINRIGKWTENKKFSDIHTQSTRESYGGLNDRFDFILISEELKNKSGLSYFNNSYTAYGNDNLHFNKSINWKDNKAVPDSIADALYNASDHIPVFADFKFDTSSYNFNDYRLFQNYPNPFNTQTKIKFYLRNKNHVTVSIYNLKGELIQTVTDTTFESGSSIVSWNGKNSSGEIVSSGVYLYRVLVGKNRAKSRKMIFLK